MSERASSVVRSACPDRRTYLLRPDLGRALAEHEAIATAVRHRDAAAARLAMHLHLAHTERDVIALTETAP